MAILDTIKGGLASFADSFVGANTAPGTAGEVKEAKRYAGLTPEQKAAEDEERKRKEAEEQAKRDAEMKERLATGTAIPGARFALNPQRTMEKAQEVADTAGKDEDTLAGVLRTVGNIAAPDEAKEAAEKEIGVPSSVGAKPLSPENQAAYNPAQADEAKRKEDPAGATIQNATQFGQQMAQQKTAPASDKTGVLDGKAEEAQRSDFGASMASKIATIATFGAMIATGVGIPFALAAAGAAWAGTGDMRSREEDAKELYKKGYNSAEINNYVHKGILPELPSEMSQQLAQSKIAAQGAKGSGKGLTEQQAKAQFGADRALASQNRWMESYGHIADDVKEYPLATLPAMYMDEVSDWKPGMVPAALKAVYPEIIKARDNEMGYLAGVLRPESGSAIGLAEWKNYGHIYFPRRGDTKESTRQKQWLRDMTVQSLYNLAQSGNMTDSQGEKVVQEMAGYSGKIRDYNRNAGAVKLDDGHWYKTTDLVGGDPTHRK